MISPLSSPRPTRPTLVRPHRDFSIDCNLRYELFGQTDFVFQIHPVKGMGQRVLEEGLAIVHTAPGAHAPTVIQGHVYERPHSGNRFLRFNASTGTLRLNYRAQVRTSPTAIDTRAEEHAIQDLPDEVMPFLLPTRYCESDVLGAAALQLFGNLPRGHRRVQAISDWIYHHLEYKIGSSDVRTTARDAYEQRAGVCRDFAHLGVSFCRALNIPARVAVGYAIFEDPPPDFHAWFEAFIGGRWVRFDATRMVDIDNLVLVATGMDAKDVAFATLFGSAQMTSLLPEIIQVDSPMPVIPMAPAPMSFSVQPARGEPPQQNLAHARAA